MDFVFCSGNIKKKKILKILTLHGDKNNMRKLKHRNL